MSPSPRRWEFAKLRRVPASGAASADSGFTLVELLVVVAILGILASLLLAGLSQAMQSARQAKCIGNLKQLQMGFLMFTDDIAAFPSNNFVYVLGRGLVPYGTWAPLSVDLAASDVPTLGGCLYPYVNSLSTYRCPSHRTWLENPLPAGYNGVIPKLHSYNLSIWLNCVSVPRGYHTESELTGSGASPGSIFGFVDTHEANILDPAYGVYHADSPLYGKLWVDVPGDRHRGRVNLSFLDGHVESWRLKTRKDGKKNGQKAEDGDDLSDLNRFQQRIPPPAPL